jgi:hypothetical protein
LEQAHIKGEASLTGLFDEARNKLRRIVMGFPLV